MEKVDINATTHVTNDLERWFSAVYALWSEHTGGSWQLIGGSLKDSNTEEDTKTLLARDWEIHDLKEGIWQVNRLIDKESHQNPITDGWDYCRAMQLLGLFYLAGFMDRSQMTDYCCTVGKNIQERFKSWTELCNSYLTGYEVWCRREFDRETAEKYIRDRRLHYESLKKAKDGPYRLPWKMKMVSDKQEFHGFYELWLSREEAWVESFRRKMKKQLWLFVVPMVVAVLGLFMWGVALTGGKKGIEAVSIVIVGTVMGAVPLIVFLVIVSLRLRRGRISKVIEKAAQAIAMSREEKEKLGLQMLDALVKRNCRIDYVEQCGNGQKNPGKLLVSEDYYYQAGVRPHVVLIRRSDIDYIKWGSEVKQLPGGGRSATLFTILFYYRSSRMARLEGSELADNGMGFYDKKIRDKVYFMMGGNVLQ